MIYINNNKKINKAIKEKGYIGREDYYKLTEDKDFICWFENGDVYVETVWDDINKIKKEIRKSIKVLMSS